MLYKSSTILSKHTSANTVQCFIKVFFVRLQAIATSQQAQKPLHPRGLSNVVGQIHLVNHQPKLQIQSDGLLVYFFSLFLHHKREGGGIVVVVGVNMS